MLKKAVSDYLLWMISKGYSYSTCECYERVLNHFLVFIRCRAIGWDDVFTFAILEEFRKQSGLTQVTTALKGLSRYLFRQKRIPRPIENQSHELPAIYEQYLLYYVKVRQVHHSQVSRTRRVLWALNDFLEKRKISLSAVTIEQIDAFLSAYNARVALGSHRHNRSGLRGFLRYLYQMRNILPKDLASLLVGAPLFAQAKPPKFLREQEVQRLFDCQKLSTPRDLRMYGLLHIARHSGMRPKEISRIRLDDLSFSKGEISLPDRKAGNPIKLPLPEDTIKAIAAYIVGARPKSDQRALFLNLRAPYAPITPAGVSNDIRCCFIRADIPASAYWLRHTYAQNLLEADASIFEVKEMMGHDRIETTRRYLHIHTRLMREVLFDETL